MTKFIFTRDGKRYVNQYRCPECFTTYVTSKLVWNKRVSVKPNYKFIAIYKMECSNCYNRWETQVYFYNNPVNKIFNENTGIEEDTLAYYEKPTEKKQTIQSFVKTRND